MITVKIDLIDFEMTMDGHAEAPREGEFDLVCCAASTIGQQLLYSLEEWGDTHAQDIDRIESEMNPGHMRIRIRPMEWARVSVISRFRYCLDGMRMLEDNYPEYIRVEVA